MIFIRTTGVLAVAAGMLATTISIRNDLMLVAGSGAVVGFARQSDPGELVCWDRPAIGPIVACTGFGGGVCNGVVAPCPAQCPPPCDGPCVPQANKFTLQAGAEKINVRQVKCPGNYQQYPCSTPVVGTNLCECNTNVPRCGGPFACPLNMWVACSWQP